MNTSPIDRLRAEQQARISHETAPYLETLHRLSRQAPDKTCSSDVAAKETAVALLAEQLLGMPVNQIMAVAVFALHLKVGTVHPFFFKQISDALEDPEGGQ